MFGFAAGANSELVDFCNAGVPVAPGPPKSDAVA